MRVRAILKLRNDKMAAAREKLGMTLEQLSKKSRVSPTEICAFQRFDWSMPRAEEKAIALAAALGIPIDDILPEGAAGQRVTADHVRTFDAPATSLLAADMAERLTLPGPLEAAEAGELRERVRDVLRSLTARERGIVELRYGLTDEGVGYTLEEVARIFKMTRERVRQVEAKGVNKLRKYPLVEKLKPLVEA